MRRVTANLAAILLLYGYQRHIVNALGPSDGDSAAHIHARYGTAPGVESVCYTYVTTLLVTVEPEQGTITTTDDFSSQS